MARRAKKSKIANRKVASQQATVMPKSKAINPAIIIAVTVVMLVVLAVPLALQTAGVTGTAAGGSAPGSSAPAISAAQQQTITSLENALKTDPKNLADLIQLGNTYYDTKQFGPAVERYSQALAIDPSNADVQTDLGTAYLNLNEVSQAIDAYNKALKIDPNKPQAHLNLGNALVSQDTPDFKGAVAEWQKAIQTANGNQDVIKLAQAQLNQYQGK